MISESVIYQDRSSINPLFPLFIFYDSLSTTNGVPLHWHDEIELITVLEGTIDLLYKGDSIIINKGDTVFINSSFVHGFYASSKSRQPALTRAVLLNPSLLCSNGYDIIQSKYINPLISGEVCIPLCLSPECSNAKKIREIIDKISDLFDKNEKGKELLIKAYLFELLYFIMDISRKEMDEVIKEKSEKRTDIEYIKKALSYIYEHKCDRIHIKDIADHLCMSEGHFSRFFKHMTHKTPLQFINEYKIGMAAQMLRKTDKKEIDISLEIGFDSFSYFISVFKRIVHCTPSEYRNSHL